MESRVGTLEAPGAAVHIDDPAVLDQDLRYVIPDGMLNGHSQIPPLYQAASAAF